MLEIDDLLTGEDFKMLWEGLVSYGYVTEAMLNSGTVEVPEDQLDRIKALIQKVSKLRAYSSEGEAARRQAVISGENGAGAQ
jgi:hypothetical protein